MINTFPDFFEQHKATNVLFLKPQTFFQMFIFETVVVVHT